MADKDRNLPQCIGLYSEHAVPTVHTLCRQTQPHTGAQGGSLREDNVSKEVTFEQGSESRVVACTWTLTRPLEGVAMESRPCAATLKIDFTFSSFDSLKAQLPSLSILCYVA